MSRIYLALFIYFGCVAVQTFAKAYSDNIEEDISLSTTELVTKYQYPVESHTATTSDGYILTIHRIPHGRDQNNDPDVAGKPIAFLMHGLSVSSSCWVVNGPGSAFAYLLAEAGYDVWMGNARGTVYSQTHVNLTTNDSGYWKFSWHEIGYYDLPAMVQYILATTEQTSMHYIGHSQGTTSVFVLLSLRPEYNDLFTSVHALAPVAYMGNLKSPLIRAIAPLANTYSLLSDLIGLNEFLPGSTFLAKYGGTACLEKLLLDDVCANALFIICGYDIDQLNNTMTPIYVGHSMQGASSRQVIHYGQEMNSKLFRQFYFGLLENWNVYESYNPPNYPIEMITAKLWLHYADNDWLAAVADVQRFYDEVSAYSSEVQMLKVSLNGFNHLDFIFADDVKELLYDDVMALMAETEEK